MSKLSFIVDQEKFQRNVEEQNRKKELDSSQKTNHYEWKDLSKIMGIVDNNTSLFSYLQDWNVDTGAARIILKGMTS